MSLRIAFYSHNGFGLGHVRRNITLAEALLARRPNADVLVITGAAGLHEFRLPPQLEYLKLPSVLKQATGRWRPRSLDIEMEQLLRLRQTMILEAVRTYRPHLFVADFLPLGVERELIPALEELAARDDARTVIGFRDVLDEPTVVQNTWALEGVPEALEQLYDLVVVYGEPDWFDFAQYGLDEGLVRYVGLLGDPDAAARAWSGPDLRLLATSGGGGDGYPVLAAALESLPRLREQLGAGVRCTAITGPLMPEVEYDRLRGIAKRAGGRVHRFAEDLASKLRRSAAVVGMGGYNTVCEVLSFRRPAVIVPRAGPSQEQPIRARILAERGLAEIVPLTECTPEALGRAVLDVLGRPFPEQALPDLGGVRRTADTLLELVE